MIPLEASRRNTRSKRPGRVERRARVVDAGNLGHEQRETDTDRRNERVLALLGRQHQHREDELAREEHFEKHALRNRHARRQRRLGHVGRAGDHARHQSRGDNAAEDLGGEEDGA